MRPLLFLLAFPLLSFASPRIGIISDSEYFGEREIGWRIKQAAEALGWEAFLDEEHGLSLQNIHSLDWTICLVFPPYLSPESANYMAVFHPFNLLDKQKKLNSCYESFDGYLLTISPQFFEGVFQSENKEFSYIPFYPTAQPIPYQKVALNTLFTTFAAWGHRTRKDRYKTLYRLLSESGFTSFYGPKDSEGIIQKGYKGPIPFDGVSIIRKIQECGIALILHSWHHLRLGIPSGRIFEAAAASAVIISDKNPFIKEHFRDSIYYIDTTLTAEEIFEQIAGHMDAIFRNPEEALEKAKQAHEIFTQKFQMTDQLLALDKMHNQIITKKTAL